MVGQDLIVRLVFWLISVTFLLIFIRRINSGYFSNRSLRDLFSDFSIGLILPLSFILSELLGNEFINNLPVIKDVAMIVEIVDNWMVLIFLVLSIGGPIKYRKNYLAAAIGGFILLVAISELNHLMNVSLALVDLAVGLSEEFGGFFTGDKYI